MNIYSVLCLGRNSDKRRDLANLLAILKQIISIYFFALFSCVGRPLLAFFSLYFLRETIIHPISLPTQFYTSPERQYLHSIVDRQPHILIFKARTLVSRCNRRLWLLMGRDVFPLNMLFYMILLAGA